MPGFRWADSQATTDAGYSILLKCDRIFPAQARWQEHSRTAPATITLSGWFMVESGRKTAERNLNRLRLVDSERLDCWCGSKSSPGMRHSGVSKVLRCHALRRYL